MAVALITGGGSGLGAVLADRLASRGHDLLLVSRDADGARRTAGGIADRHGVRADVLCADLATRHGLFRVEALLSGPEAPAVDVVVHDALSEPGGPARPAELGVTAPARLTHAVLPGMLRRGAGTVVLVDAVPDGGPGAGWAPAFADSLTAGLDGTGVRAVVVRPGEDVTGVLPGGARDAEPARGPAALRGLPQRTVAAARRGAELLADATRGPLMPPAAPRAHGAGARPGCGRTPEELLAGGPDGPGGPVRAPARLPDVPVRPGAGRSTAHGSGRGRSAHYVAGSLRTAEQRARAAAAARARGRSTPASGTVAVPGC